MSPHGGDTLRDFPWPLRDHNSPESQPASKHSRLDLRKVFSAQSAKGAQGSSPAALGEERGPQQAASAAAKAGLGQGLEMSADGAVDMVAWRPAGQLF